MAVSINQHDLQTRLKQDYLDVGLRIKMYLPRRWVRYFANSFAIALVEFVLA